MEVFSIKLIQFEIKKILKSAFFLPMLLILSLFILGFYVFASLNTVKPSDEAASVEEQLYGQEQSLQELKDSIESEEEIDPNLEKEIEFAEEFMQKTKFTLEAYKQEDWEYLLNQEIELDEEFVSSGVFKREYYTSTWPTLFTSETRLEYNKWMRDKEITPVFPIDFISWKTAYDVVFDDVVIEDIVRDISTKYSSSGFYFLNNLFNNLFGVFGAIFFLFLFGDIVTKEGIGRNGPIHLLHTQPINRYKVLGSKFTAVLMISILVLIGTSMLSLLLGTIFSRLGDWNYPVLIYGEEYAHEFMNMSTYLLYSSILFVMILVFCYAILFLFSVLTKKTSIALGLTLATIYVGITWSKESVLSTIAPYIPFHYFSVSEVVTNELAVTLENFNFSYANGMISLGITSAVLLVLTYVLSSIQGNRGN